MKLIDLMSVVDGDEVVHITDEVKEKTVFYGKMRTAYYELDETVIKTRKVMRVYNGFGGLCITTVED